MPAEKSFLSLVRNRASVIMNMTNYHLSLDWVRAYSLDQLSACCERMAEYLSGESIADKTLQCELIQNPAFAAYYAKLMTLLPEEPESPPEPNCPRPGPSRYPARPGAKPDSRHVCSLSGLGLLVQASQKYRRNITAYPADEVANALELDELSSEQKLVFLENFISGNLPPETRKAAADSIKNCIDLPVTLTQGQKDFLLEPFTASRYVFSLVPFDEIWALVESCPGLKDIFRLLHELGIDETLGLEDYRAMVQDVSECGRLLRSIARQMDAAAMSGFLSFWRKGGCTAYELRRMERWISSHPGQDWDGLLSNYSGYINLLYGKRFKEVDLAGAEDYQEDILIYAITQNKKRFIRLVDGHSDVFLRLPRTSMLFQERLYREHFNLNELTEKALADCAGMAQGRLPVDRLSPGYQYSFQELQALYGLPNVYFKFYAALQSDDKDYKLTVLKQLSKRKLLRSVMDEAEISILAERLSVKTLYDWLEKDFRHIAGLAAGDAVEMLIHLDELRGILPSCRRRADIQLALRNLKWLSQYGDIELLKADIIQVDADWKSLSAAMGLTPEFLDVYHDNILRFACANGAYIAERYRSCLDCQRQEAFFRVVKAELMGKLDELKYFEGDLQRELDSPLTMPVKTGWKRNLGISRNGLEVREHDDFLSTMLLGTRPQRTCMSYLDGAYRECLLSAFDSNKKVLYASLDGQIIGRAFLRLTKGRLAGADQRGGFTFVDLENTASRPECPSNREQITLFLERPYISGAGPELEGKIKQMFTELACRKADGMNVMLILNTAYQGSCEAGFARTRYDIYISASKAGKQYLDSLDGEASVTAEGSYKTNTFLVRETGALQCACNS